MLALPPIWLHPLPSRRLTQRSADSFIPIAKERRRLLNAVSAVVPYPTTGGSPDRNAALDSPFALPPSKDSLQ